MSKFRITFIDTTLAATNIKYKLKGLVFEGVTKALRLILGDNYFIYEGNNHIVVQSADKSEKLIFIERD